MTYTQVWYVIGIVSSSPTYFHSESIGLIRVTTYLPLQLISQTLFWQLDLKECEILFAFGTFSGDSKIMVSSANYAMFQNNTMFQSNTVFRSNTMFRNSTLSLSSNRFCNHASVLPHRMILQLKSFSILKYLCKIKTRFNFFQNRKLSKLSVIWLFPTRK